MKDNKILWLLIGVAIVTVIAVYFYNKRNKLKRALEVEKLTSTVIDQTKPSVQVDAVKR